MVRFEKYPLNKYTLKHYKVKVDVPHRPGDPYNLRKQVRGTQDHVGGLIQKIVETMQDEGGV